MLGTTDVSLATVYVLFGGIILLQIVLLIVVNKLLIARRKLRAIHSYLDRFEIAQNAINPKSIIPE